MIICSLCGRDIGASNFIVVKNEGTRSKAICDKCYKANDMKVFIKYKNEEYDVEEIG